MQFEQIKWQLSWSSVQSAFSRKEKGNAALLLSISTVFKCFPAKLILVYSFVLEVLSCTLHDHFCVDCKLQMQNSNAFIHFTSYSWEFTNLKKLLSICFAFETKALRRQLMCRNIIIRCKSATDKSGFSLERKSWQSIEKNKQCAYLFEVFIRYRMHRIPYETECSRRTLCSCLIWMQANCISIFN